jgi:hypothetical protein
MMLHKSLISFIAALTVVTSVTASTTPAVRDGGSKCDTGSLQCCVMTAYSDNKIVAALESLANIAIPADTSIPLGITCLGILASSSW